MKVSYIQIFDQKANAMKALGFISSAFPENSNSLIDASNQIQVWSKFAGKDSSSTYGELDDDIVYLVLSLAKPEDA